MKPFIKEKDKMNEAMEFDSEKKAKMKALMALVKQMDSLMGNQLKGVKEVKMEIEPSDEDKVDMQVEENSIEKKMMDDEEECIMGDEENDGIFSNIKKCR